MDTCLWKESKWENADKEVVRLYNRSKERVYAKKEKDIFIVKKREKRSMWVHRRINKERVY